MCGLGDTVWKGERLADRGCHLRCVMMGGIRGPSAMGLATEGVLIRVVQKQGRKWMGVEARAVHGCALKMEMVEDTSKQLPNQVHTQLN